MKMKFSAIAAAVAAATLSMAADASTIDFHGYARSGSGASSKGGSLVCYWNGSMGHFRLGNECDTYLEMHFDSLLAEKAGSQFKLHTMLAAGTQQLTDWEQNTPAWRQLWTEATNVGSGPLANASLWVGKRYYKRQDIHMLDYFYNEVTGPGAGLEGVDVGGVAKFSYAYMRQVATDYDSATSVGKIRPDYDSTNGAKSLTNHDFRLEGLAIGDFGSVDLMGNIAQKSNRNGVDGKGGYAFTAQHTIGVLGGFNRVHYTFAKDASTLSHGVKTWTDSSYSYTGNQIMDHLVFDFGAINGSAVIGYQTEKGPSWYNGTTRKEFTVAVRPWYHFNDLYAVGAEIGHSQVKPEKNGATQNLSKVTLAGQLSAGKGYWARPALRAYYTYAKWNDALKGSGVTCSGRDCGTNVSSSGFADATSGSTYGVQMEAWW